MNILVINSGSSSLKYQLIEMKTKKSLAKGLIEKIGGDDAIFNFEGANGRQVKEVMAIGNHEKAVELGLRYLLGPDYGVIKSLDDIVAVGHRVVHGGETFRHGVVVDGQVKEKICEYGALAPLHNPANLSGILACEKVMPNTPQVAVFDTAFHATIEPHAYLYGLPYDFYEKYQIRRYGFHGTSHRYVTKKAAETLGKPLDSLKIISCHLGNGASIAALENGKVVDTSMGFTPLEGLMMGTRPGSFDPAIILFLMEKEQLSISEMDYILNKKSGLLGVSGVSNDFRDIEKAIEQGNTRALLAKDIYIHLVKKTIGSYVALLNGLDVLLFTAGLGENGIAVREEICSDLGYLGIAVDPVKNNCRGKLVDISADNAKVVTMVIPTDEEMMIAEETMVLLGLDNAE